MASTVIRRPLPALISLVALLLLTGIVWWRVMNRGDDSSDAAAPCPTPTPAATQTVLPAPAAITVQVLNATTTNGLAAKVSTSLNGAGFKTVDPGNDKTKHSTSATITYGPSGKQAATLVQYYFPGSTLTAGTSKSATVVVSLGSRFKTIASKSTVTAALKQADLRTASAAPSTPAANPTSGASASC